MRNPKILWMVRTNSDFERCGATMFGIGREFPFHLYFTFGRETFKNELIWKVIRDSGVPTSDYSDLSFFSRIGRKLKQMPAPMNFLGRILNRIGLFGEASRISAFLEKLAPHLLVIDYVADDLDSNEFRTIHGWAIKRKIPVIITVHGAGVIFPAKNLSHAATSFFFQGNYPLAAHKLEFDIRLPGLRKFDKSYITGDQRFSPEFVKHLHNLTEPFGPPDGRSKITVYGGNLNDLGVDDNKQDALVFRCVKRLAEAFPESTIRYKYHPYTLWTDWKAKIGSLPNVVVVPPFVNTSRLVKDSELVVSVPSSVMTEPLMLGKKFVLLDFWTGSSDFIRVYEKGNLPVVNESNLDSFDFAGVKPTNESAWLLEFLHGGVPGKTPIDHLRDVFRSALLSADTQ